MCAHHTFCAFYGNAINLSFAQMNKSQHILLLQIEDRPIVKEIKTYVREHHPVEKEFVVETRPTGMQCFCLALHCCSLCS